MARGKIGADTVLINVTVPRKWRKELEVLALEYGMKAGRVVTLQEFLRVSIKDLFNLSEDDEQMNKEVDAI